MLSDMKSAKSAPLLAPLFAGRKMREIFSDAGRIGGMLRFEAALARAEARVGVIPQAAAAAIESQCRAELFDRDKLGQGAALAGNPAVPLVTQLAALVEREDRAAAQFVHFGATSQDAMDTGLVLQLRDALDAIETDLAALSEILAAMASAHTHTLMAGRTWMQQALPITFGLKAAGWLSAIERHRARIAQMRPRVLVLQLGGAAGTLAAFGENGLRVAEALAQEVRLGVPDIPWHAHRDRLAEVAATAGLLTGTLGKIARDVSLLMQTEIGEVFEPQGEGRGGSSTLPQKHNPVGCAATLSAAIRVPALVSVMLTAMVQENERGLGNWHAEWDTLPEIFLLTGGAIEQMTAVLGGLRVDAARMEENLEATRGQIFAEAIVTALAPAMGRLEAKRLVEQAALLASRQNRHLREVLAEDPRLRERFSAAEMERLFQPSGYLGQAGAMIDGVVKASASAKSGSGKK